MNHGQFTGRFFTLMNDNTGHQKYSILLSKKKWAGLFFTIVQEEVGRFIKENRAPQITVLVVGAVGNYRSNFCFSLSKALFSPSMLIIIVLFCFFSNNLFFLMESFERSHHSPRSTSGS